MQSIVDTEAPVEIASQRADNHRGKDRKVNLIVNELRNGSEVKEAFLSINAELPASRAGREWPM